jgi:hypothetical protein
VACVPLLLLLLALALLVLLTGLPWPASMECSSAWACACHGSEHSER